MNELTHIAAIAELEYSISLSWHSTPMRLLYVELGLSEVTSCNKLLITDDISPSEQPDGKQTPNERPPYKIKKEVVNTLGRCTWTNKLYGGKLVEAWNDEVWLNIQCPSCSLYRPANVVNIKNYVPNGSDKYSTSYCYINRSTWRNFSCAPISTCENDDSYNIIVMNTQIALNLH